jgi:hypothetical protein
MRSGIGTWPLCLALAAVGCDEGGGVTEPPTPTPQATPLGTFAIVSASPAFGGTVSGSQSELQGTSGLAVTFQMTYTPVDLRRVLRAGPFAATPPRARRPTSAS